jgi:hypothetical protein
MNIKEELNRLSEYQSQKDLIELQKKEMIDSVLTPEIMEQVRDIEAEFAGKAESVSENIAELTNEIKAAVISSGEKVKGDYLQAVYVKGRKKWDTKGLEGYAKAHPEVADFLTEGKPSVSIRKV